MNSKVRFVIAITHIISVPLHCSKSFDKICTSLVLKGVRIIATGAHYACVQYTYNYIHLYSLNSIYENVYGKRSLIKKLLMSLCPSLEKDQNIKHSRDDTGHTSTTNQQNEYEVQATPCNLFQRKRLISFINIYVYITTGHTPILIILFKQRPFAQLPI